MTESQPRPPLLSRRVLIGGGGVALGAGALALSGCAARPPSDGPDASGSPSAPGQGAGALAAGTELAKLADIPVGGTASRRVEGHEVLLAQPNEGEVVAFSAICTHQGCVVGAAPSSFDCSCHGSRFEAATGEVLNGPAQRPLTAIAVTVSGDGVVVS